MLGSDGFVRNGCPRILSVARTALGLTEAKKKNLEDKGFDRLFTKRKANWTKLVREAHKYAKENMTEGRDPRPDDVAKVLYPMIEVDKAFRDHQHDNKARQPRYIGWFTDYVIDQVLARPGGNRK